MMDFKADTEFELDGVLHRIVFSDFKRVVFEQLDSGHTTIESREVLEDAYAKGNLAPYTYGFDTDVWRSNSRLTLDMATDYERKIVAYRLPYARHFAMNVVSAADQEAVCISIGERHNHTTFARPSSARRWAAKLRRSRINPASLIDLRCKSIKQRQFVA
jgi:hypothetical protein